MRQPISEASRRPNSANFPTGQFFVVQRENGAKATWGPGLPSLWASGKFSRGSGAFPAVRLQILGPLCYHHNLHSLFVFALDLLPLKG